MAKKMKVVVRRKEAATERTESPPGSCFVPFKTSSKKTTEAKKKQRSLTPRRKRASAATSSNASSADLFLTQEDEQQQQWEQMDETEQLSTPATASMDFTGWESFPTTPEFPPASSKPDFSPTPDFGKLENHQPSPEPVSVKKEAATAFGFDSNNPNNVSVSGETASTHPLSRGSSATSSHRTMPASPDRSVEQLLTLPAPVDRSDKRRLKYEREKRQRGPYEGEMEPVGKRGQEAQVKQSNRLLGASTNGGTSNSNNHEAPQIRSFQAQPRSTERKNFAGKQVTLVLPALKDEPPPPSTPARSVGRNDLVSPARSSLSTTPSAVTSTAAASTTRSVVPYAKPPPAPTRISRAQTPTTPPTRNNNTRPSTPSNRPGTAAIPDDAASYDDEDASELSNGQYLPPVQLHTGTGRAVRGRFVLETPAATTPAAYFSPRPNHQQQQPQPDYDDDESTQSDEELRQMQPDLMPSFSMDMESNRPHEVPPQYQQQPSPAAAAAAAAAAATLQQQEPAETMHPDNQVEEINTQAMEAVQEGRLNDAVDLFATVLSMQKSQHGEKHPTVASAYHNLGTVQAKRAATLRHDAVAQQLCRTAALEAFQAAARTARDSLGSTHPNVAVSLVRIGFLLLHSKQYANALITFAEALRIRLTAFGKDHALTANLYNNLGVCHMHLEEFDQGRRALHTGLAIQRKLCAESDAKSKTNGTVPWLELADTLFNIGGLCLEWIRKLGPDLRRAEESEDAFAEAYEIRLRILGHDDSSTKQVRELLAIARSIPRPKPRSNSPGPRRWRSEEAVALYEPPATPKSVVSPKSTGRSISPIARSGTPVSHASRGTPVAPITPDSVNSRKFVYATPDSSRPSDDGHINSLDRTRKEQTDEIFRTRSSGSTNRSAKVVTPPVMEVTFSQDSDPKAGESTESGEKKDNGTTTRIYMSSHLVPGEPLLHVDKNKIQEGLKNASFDDEREPADRRNDVDTSGVATRLFRSHEYDNEENCMISDSGVDSEHGRVHFPLAWNKAGLQTIAEMPPANSRDIVVTRPFRSHSFSRTPSTSSERWGSETVNMGDAAETFSTGNKERDEIMSRAKALLASNDSKMDESTEHVNQSLTVEPSRSIDPIDEEFDLPRGKTVNEDLLMEDGLAPLGGEWRSSSLQWNKAIMLPDPMKYLPSIHDQACKELNADNFVDAVHLFDVVLQCQKRRHGVAHADVASALYNLGIAQLRSQNHGEALKAFEEAARTRKSVLGREHPQVAVSLVKVGITLLLLHRFEEALWSFREALSVRRSALGTLHPSTARIYNNIGCVHVEFNEFREARRAFESALDIQRSALCNEPESGPLMFGAATTLCNLGYLYRYQSLHAKAAVVLKEAVDLQETVLGRSHATVLSTLDNLADSCASSGQAADALRHYNTILTRFRVGGRSGSQKLLRAEAVLIYKMSRVHRQRNDLESQLDSLKLALRAVRALSDPSVGGAKTDALERRIQYDIRSCRERIEKSDLKWV